MVRAVGGRKRGCPRPGKCGQMERALDWYQLQPESIRGCCEAAGDPQLTLYLQELGAFVSFLSGSLEAPGARVLPVPFQIPVLCSAVLLGHLTEAQLWPPRLKPDLVLPAPLPVLLSRVWLARQPRDQQAPSRAGGPGHGSSRCSEAVVLLGRDWHLVGPG